ncbi:unnamed protein product [Brachionus calyciflorus]|uniref:Uncharacterized protein n=1 Tax=Brachionus calyciflorus TaxID=104777 RepID=A0A813NUK1_9BILA|nr:unnamed protein product [Brachionus calyciflorus]
MLSIKFFSAFISLLVIFGSITPGLSLKCAVCKKCPGAKHGNKDSFEQPTVQECSPEEKYCMRAIQTVQLKKMAQLKFINQGCVSQCSNSTAPDLKVTCCQQDECNLAKPKNQKKNNKQNSKKAKSG